MSLLKICTFNFTTLLQVIYTFTHLNNENMSANLSPNRKALMRLLKNKPALCGLGVIALSIFVALFGYLIAPDHTPNGNNQMPTVALKNPGFAIKILALKKHRPINTSSFLSKIWGGSESSLDYIPINAYQIEGDSIKIEKYDGEEPDKTTGKLQLRKGKTAIYHLVDVAYPVSSDKPVIEKKDNQYSFTNIDGITKTVDKASLSNTLADNQILTKHFYLGTDNFGRDNLSRLLLGVRISLLVGLIAVIISLTIGILLGSLAGYFGGRTDDFVMLLINTVWSIPTILLVFAIVLAFGRGIGIIFLAVGLTMWVDVARIVRGQVMSLKEVQFVEAAQSMGFGTLRIILRHILPNILGPVMVVAASNFATAILIESGLSYLGFGIQPPTPSWGTMLNENYGYAIGGKPFLALVPALAIMIMVLAFNLVGNGFRDALDVKDK
jgi:peptide/nickel transport system permease protein